MASRKQKKARDGATETASAAAADSAQKGTAPAASTARNKATSKAAGRQAATPRRRGPGRPKGSKTKSRTVRKPVAKKPARPRRYTPAERARVLAAAMREGLSGPAAAKKFGISEVTYYLWKKNARPAIRRAARAVRKSRIIDVAGEVRERLRDQIRRTMPDVVRKEIDAVLADLSGARRRGRRR